MSLVGLTFKPTKLNWFPFWFQNIFNKFSMIFQRRRRRCRGQVGQHPTTCSEAAELTSGSVQVVGRSSSCERDWHKERNAFLRISQRWQRKSNHKQGLNKGARAESVRQAQSPDVLDAAKDENSILGHHQRTLCKFRSRTSTKMTSCGPIVHLKKKKICPQNFSWV